MSSKIPGGSNKKLIQRTTVETTSKTERMLPEKAEIDEKSEVGDQTPSQLTQSYYNKNTAVTDKR